jgi:hypothetical protein
VNKTNVKPLPNPASDTWIQVHVNFSTPNTSLIISEEFLEQIFCGFGGVADITVKRHLVYQHPPSIKGYGFVFFNESYPAFRAVKELKAKVIDGIRFDCCLSHRAEQSLMGTVSGNPVMQTATRQFNNQSSPTNFVQYGHSSNLPIEMQQAPGIPYGRFRENNGSDVMFAPGRGIAAHSNHEMYPQINPTVFNSFPGEFQASSPNTVANNAVFKSSLSSEFGEEQSFVGADSYLENPGLFFSKPPRPLADFSNEAGSFLMEQRLQSKPVSRSSSVSGMSKERPQSFDSFPGNNANNSSVSSPPSPFGSSAWSSNNESSFYAEPISAFPESTSNSFCLSSAILNTTLIAPSSATASPSFPVSPLPTIFN